MFSLSGRKMQHSGMSAQVSATHLLTEAHQLVEMDFRRSNECPGATPAVDNTFFFQLRERVPRSHKAHPMEPGELSFRIHRIARL